jgi:hypothetical protein
MKQTIVIFILIIIILLSINSVMPGHLNNFDGHTHYNYVKNSEDCLGYPGFMCMTMKPIAMMGEYWFWATFFIILGVIIPFIYYFYTKDKKILLGYFFFTGFFFTAETLQIYAQVLITIPMLIFFLTKNKLLKLGILLFLITTHVYGYPIHSQQGILTIFLCFTMVLQEIKFKNISLFFVTGPIEIYKYVRESVLLKNENYLFGAVIYYTYHFFFKNMLFLFSIPAAYNLIKEKNWYEFLFFVFIFFGALFYWVYEGFNVWRVTRVLVWLPIFLLPSFMRWMKTISPRNQKIMWVIGSIYLLIQCYIYFVNKVNIFYG